jgi:hypothetical protein
MELGTWRLQTKLGLLNWRTNHINIPTFMSALW